jgi:hypothetical protein
MDNPLLNHRSEIDQALFFAIARNDFETAHSLLEGTCANPNAIFQLEKGVFVSSFNLFISKTASLGQAKGHNNAQYLSGMKLMKELIKRSTLECKCIKEHKCPLYIALETFRITEEEQVLACKCDLVRSLIVAGASIKFEPRQDQRGKGDKWSLKWLDLEGLRSYLITKNCNYV